MSVVLALETSTLSCSVSICKGKDIIASKTEVSDKYIHSERLHVFIKEVLKDAGIRPEDVSAIAVDSGPGSYTGLRIGVSAAKGLCYALNIPLISINSLQLLASELALSENITEGDIIIPMIDARRMEVYCAEYDHNGHPLSNIEARVIEESSFEHLNGRRLHFLGDGSPKVREMLKGPSRIFHNILYPSSEILAVEAQKKLIDKEFEDVAYFEPFYLKDFIAGKPKKLL